VSDARRIAERLLRRQGAAPRPEGSLPWESGFFGLPNVRSYATAPERVQRAVLDDCTAALLSESWFIERAGITFCARMTLAAASEDERRMFALIGADEAVHSSWLEPWIRDRAAPADPFSRFIGGLAAAGNSQPLSYLLQIVLEGFGIAHYAGLAAGCRDTALAALLKRMSQDEAAHHAAGLAVFRAEHLSLAEQRFLAEAAYAFLEMIRSGPQAVAAALARHVEVDAEQAFAELDAEADSAGKLAQLRRLFAQPGMESLVEELERKGAFTPCSAAQCAALARATQSAPGP
jgi:rubrerythrin